MVGSVICLLISILFRITIGTLEGTKFAFLAGYKLYANLVCIGLAVIVAFFAVLKILPEINGVINKKPAAKRKK